MGCSEQQQLLPRVSRGGWVTASKREGPSVTAELARRREEAAAPLLV